MGNVVLTQTPTITTLVDAVRQTAGRFGDKVALKGEGGQGRSLTYRQLMAEIDELAIRLAAPRFTDISDIGLLSENRPEWPVAYLGILEAGKTVVPIDANLKPEELATILQKAALRVVLCSKKYQKLLQDSGSTVGTIVIDADSKDHWRSLERPRVLNSIPQNPLAAVIYTSGTTGSPRGVMLTHQNILANLAGVRPALPFDSTDIFLSVLPLHHTYEATCGFLTPLTSGATVVYARSLKSKEILDDIAANGVTVMCGVPLLYEKIYHAMLRSIQNAPVTKRVAFNALYGLSAIGWRTGSRWGVRLFRGLRKTAGLGTLRMFVSGGAAIPPEISKFYNLLGFTFLQGYGMTECSPVVSSNRPDDIRFGSVGPVLGNIEVRIHEPNDEGVGEIVVRGPSITSGYRNNPEKTAELLREGWLHTGDLGRLRDRHIWITGRKKNIIVSAAGKNIYPEEIEEKLYGSPYVLEAVVFGHKNDSSGREEVWCIIVPDIEQFRLDLSDPTAEPAFGTVKARIGSLVKEVNAGMAEFKRISQFEVQLAELEKTSTKKIKRFVYNQPAAQ